ncbi:MAG: hypothetical protein COV36_02725 [Alphaproteobacteria bacterium CG11_big_fil_rev_8_21_14_0_20_44_7]|nr:MAG: hypothetical protein COV36_02725 [Alphaproteobacteria bacterium CG11_big_fil_rev_8_21_14_0_20_44_7]
MKSIKYIVIIALLACGSGFDANAGLLSPKDVKAAKEKREAEELQRELDLVKHNKDAVAELQAIKNLLSKIVSQNDELIKKIDAIEADKSATPLE